MKGICKNYEEKIGKAGAYGKVKMDEGGAIKDYLVRDAVLIAALKGGGEVEYDTTPSKDGSATWMNPKKGESKEGFKGGFKKAPSKDESFAASYAKDIAVACINKDLNKSSVEIDATIQHYYKLFMGLL